jgi:drug/metabolite transporter (DMT)-like permease
VAIKTLNSIHTGQKIKKYCKNRNAKTFEIFEQRHGNPLRHHQDTSCRLQPRQLCCGKQRMNPTFTSISHTSVQSSYANVQSPDTSISDINVQASEEKTYEPFAPKVQIGGLQGSGISTEKSALFLPFLIYFALSSSMLIINKATLARFPFPVCLAAVQTVSSAVLLCTLKWVRIIRFDVITLEKLLAWKWVAIAWTTPFICNFYALKYVSVEAMMTFRSTSIIFVVIADYFVLGSKVTIQQFFSCILIAGGGFVFAWNDSSTTFRGWAWGLLYSMGMVANSVYIKHAFNQQVNMGSWEKTFLNNFTASPLIMLLACQEDVSGAFVRLSQMPSSDALLLLLSCFGGFGMNATNFIQYSSHIHILSVCLRECNFL